MVTNTWNEIVAFVFKVEVNENGDMDRLYTSVEARRSGRRRKAKRK
jgi:hypothetical protein